jgi:hypothetical protein
VLCLLRLMALPVRAALQVWQQMHPQHRQMQRRGHRGAPLLLLVVQPVLLRVGA